MAVTSGTIYRFTNAAFPSKALNVYASGTTISARRNVCLYTNDTSDVMQQWVPVGNETDGYFLKSNATTAYSLHYSTGTDAASCTGNADVESGIAKNPEQFRVNFEYLGNNKVKIKHRYTGKYLTAYSNANGGSNSITDVGTTGNVYWATGSSTLGNKQVWNISPSIDEETIIGNQNLIMPVNEMKITCGYKVPIYLTLGYGAHYGVDYRDINIVDNYSPIPDNIIASGEGYIYRSGYDNNAGYFACIVYPNAYIKTSSSGTRHYQDITVRYWHMNSLSIPTVSDYNTPVRIHKNDVIGTMGMLGVADGIHVHVECDTDTTPQYTFWSPTHWASPNILQNGIDSTINPGWVFQKGEGQTVIVYQEKIDTEWVLSDDYSYLGNVTIE